MGHLAAGHGNPFGEDDDDDAVPVTQPRSEMKLYARFKTPDYKSGDTLEINTIQQAVDYGAKTGAMSFQTYAVASITMNGKVFTGEPETAPGTHYLRVDKILTAAEIAARFAAKAEEYKKKIERDETAVTRATSAFNASTAPWNQKIDLLTGPQQQLQSDKEWALVYETMPFKNYPPSAPYIEDIGGKGGEYTEIKAGDKVYNKQGRQIYPQPSAAPASKSSPRP